MTNLDIGDSRHWLIDRLTRYAKRYPQERSVNEICDFVRMQPHCFERECFIDGHVTGSAWVVCPRRKRVLLTHHRKLGKWLQLGGHCDGDANTIRVARREAQEESGIQAEAISEALFDVDIHIIPPRSNEPEHKHYDIRFLFEADDAEELVVSTESNDLRWVHLDKLGDLMTDASVLRMACKTCSWLNQGEPLF